MGNLDDAVSALEVALSGNDPDNVELAMGRVKGYLRRLKSGKSVQVEGYDREMPGNRHGALAPSGRSAIPTADATTTAAWLNGRGVSDPRSPDYDANAAIENRLTPEARANIAQAKANRVLQDRVRKGDFESSGPQVTPYIMRDRRAEARIIAAGIPDTEALRGTAASLAAKEDGTGYWGSLAEELDFIADRRDEAGGPTVSDLNERAKAEGSGAPSDMSMSERTDRDSLPQDLRSAKIVGRGLGEWLMTTDSGHFVHVYWGKDGEPTIWRYPDTEPLPRAAEDLIAATNARLRLSSDSVDDAEDALIVALANVNVKSYTRRSKTGKSVKVSAYVRRMNGADLSPGMEVKDVYGKPHTVKAAGPTGVTFTDGTKGGPKQVFTVPEVQGKSASNPPRARTGSGYDANAIEKAGFPGAKGSKVPAAKATEPKTARTQEPMDDAEYQAHTQNIEKEISAAMKEGKATDKQFAVDINSGIWEDQRTELHRKIADEMWEAAAANIPNEGKAMISGGLGGAGKSTVLKIAGPDIASQYFTVNSDDVKEHIANNYPDMIPEAGGLSPLERVALIHEESSHIADILAARAYREKKNMVWDITMASQRSVQKRIDDLRANGYDDVKAVFVDIDVETSVTRALARHRRGMEDFRNGKGQGGRYVPPHIIRLNKSDSSSSANRETFDSLKDQFDSWQVFNNNIEGRAPVREDEGTGSGAKAAGAPGPDAETDPVAAAEQQYEDARNALQEAEVAWSAARRTGEGLDAAEAALTAAEDAWRESRTRMREALGK